MLDSAASPPCPCATEATIHPAAAATARSDSGLTCWPISTREHRRSAPPPARWQKMCPGSCAALSTTSWPDAAAPSGSAPEPGPGRAGQGTSAAGGRLKVPVKILSTLGFGSGPGLTLPATDAEICITWPIAAHRRVLGTLRDEGPGLTGAAGNPSTPRDRLERPTTATGLRAGLKTGLGAGLRAGLAVIGRRRLPGLAPVVIAVLVQQPVELAFDPATQFTRIEPRRRSPSLTAGSTARTGPGPGHPIHQLATRLNPTVKTLFQPLVVPTRHRCRLATPHTGPALET